MNHNNTNTNFANDDNDEATITLLDKSRNEDQVQGHHESLNSNSKPNLSHHPIFYKDYKGCGGSVCSVQLTIQPNGLAIKALNNTSYKHYTNDLITVNDAIGASYAQVKAPKRIKKAIKDNTNANSDDNDNDKVYKLKVHMFTSKKKGVICCCANRKNKTREFMDEEFYCVEEEQARRWQNILLHWSHNTEWFKNSMKNEPDLYANVPDFQKKLLAFINPNSGSGNAQKRWDKVKHILANAGYETTIIHTTSHRHCLEYLKTTSLDLLKEYNGFIAISGDGLIHEIINGIYQRLDYSELSHIPVGYIPGGSGNAHIKNLSEMTKEKCNLETAVYILVKGKTLNIDMTVIELENQPSRIYSFLSFTWCFIADIDIESEFLRCCGGARFDILAYWRLIKLRRYQAKLGYTTKLELQLPELNQEINDQEWKSIDDEFIYFTLGNGPFLSEDFKASPLSSYNDGYNDLAFQYGNTSRWPLTKLLLAASDGSQIKDNKPAPGLELTYEKIKGFRIEPYGPAKGIFSIDGERYDAKKAQGFVWPSSLKIFGYE